MVCFARTLHTLAAAGVVVSLSLIATAPTCDAVATTGDSAPKTGKTTAGKGKAKGKGKPKKKAKKAKKPKEIVDLMAQLGRSICTNLGGLIKKTRGAEWRVDIPRRCDLFIDAVEDLGSMSDAMAKEMEVTQMQLVNSALRPQHYMTLQMNLKNAAKVVLAAKKPSEKSVSEELGKSMSQWILNVATQVEETEQSNDERTADAVGKMSREQMRNLRNMGIKLPSWGRADDDELDEEEYLVGEDYEWAKNAGQQKVADAGMDDDDDIDEDDDEL